MQGSPQFGDEVGLLFDLAADPGEIRNQRHILPTDFETMAAISDRHVSTLTPGQAVLQPALRPGAVEDLGTAGLSQEAEEQLRELGYIE